MARAGQYSAGSYAATIQTIRVQAAGRNGLKAKLAMRPKANEL